MSTPVYFTKSLTGASANGIAASQSLAAPGNLTLTSTTVTLDTPRRVLLTFAADETGHNFTVYGYPSTTLSNTPISETLAGTTAGTVATTRDFGQVTRIAVNAATTGNLTAGTNGVGSSHWVSSNYQVTPSQWSIGCVVSGTVNYSIQYTYDDFWSVPLSQTQGAVPVAWTDPVINGATATADTVLTNPITGWRLLINSGTGSVAVRAVQSDISGA